MSAKVIAGVDVGNATTEVAIVSGGHLLGVDRLPTRGRKGSPESLRGAAALLRRLERRLGCVADEARIAQLRAVDTTTLTIPRPPAPAGRLRVLAAGVATPGGNGAWVGVPFWLDAVPPAVAPRAAVSPDVREPAAGWPAVAFPAGAFPPGPSRAGGSPAVAVVAAGFGYDRAAARLRALLAAGVRVGAVLVAGDEGVLIANRLPVSLPVIDEVDAAAVAGCARIAVEVRPPGQPMTLLADPVALAAALSLDASEAADAVALCRTLVDYSNAVVGYARAESADGGSGQAGSGRPGADRAFGQSVSQMDDQLREPWVRVGDERMPLRTACAQVAGWPVGAVSELGSAAGQTEVADLFALDLAAVADTATARRHGLGQAALVASLRRPPDDADHAAQLAELLGRPVRRLLSEPAAARLGALTTPGARSDAVVVDLGAGTIDVIAPDGEVVAAGAGDLLTNAVAETVGIPRAAADWVKRGPCVRVDGGQRFEAEDGSRGFLDRPAPASAVGMLAAAGPAGLLPFDRSHTPAEWRAIRLRLKQAVFAVNLRRALDTPGTTSPSSTTSTTSPSNMTSTSGTSGTLGTRMSQVVIVGGPAGDDELLGVLLRFLPREVGVGRGNVGGTLGTPAGHRFAAALGLALGVADPDGLDWPGPGRQVSR